MLAPARPFVRSRRSRGGDRLATERSGLGAWLTGRPALLSIDIDYFVAPDEAPVFAPLSTAVEQLVRRGVPLHRAERHAAMVDLPLYPIDLVINLDFHMDCRVGYLFGAPPQAPPCDATVMEGLLTAGRIGNYLWALPTSRYAEAATVYGRAAVLQQQPTLARIHCMEGQEVVSSLLPLVDVQGVFVCRSPEYGTPATDALYRRLVGAPGLKPSDAHVAG